MLPAKSTILFFVFAITMATAMAQPPKQGAKNTPVQKFKPPKLTSMLGTRSDSVVVSVDEGLHLIDLPLQITDDKKNVYTLSTYQFLYRRKGVTEDEVTGKVTPITSIVAKQFNATPLPATWANIVKEELQPGEELFFFDIVVKDAQGRLMFAPNIKLKTQ
jgi:hypothetical protein